MQQLIQTRDCLSYEKHITFINEHKRQNIKNIITADIECCFAEVSTNNCKYVIAEYIPIAVG